LFAVSKTKYQIYRLPITEKRLRKEVEGFRSAIQARGNYKDRAVSIYKYLLSPAEKQIDRSQRLLVCPDGPLHALPFAVLMRPGTAGKHLVEYRPLHFVVSMNVYRQLRQMRPIGTQQRTHGYILALADPTLETQPSSSESDGSNRQELLKLGSLKDSIDEIRVLQHQYGDQVHAHTGTQATVRSLYDEGKGAWLIHLACHGLLNDRDPLSSALVLSPTRGNNGLLTVYEILQRLSLHADLVMLSACATGLGQTMNFEGVIGLARALQYAGARSIGVSLWSVETQSKAALMVSFYRALGQSSRDEALRRAQIRLLHSKEWNLPFYWAAYQIVGDWK
jgi:CHAT domain-containing protein